ncbi:MAG: toxin-antitoxin system HicB family antitoxin [Chlamydiales bacterium]
MSANFNLRNIAPEVMTQLKREASEQGISVNSLILQYLERSLGITKRVKKTPFHDLDDLAGTWSKKDKIIFESNIKPFEQIDKELWS